MSMSDGEVIDLLYDKLNKTVRDCDFQSVYLNTPNYVRKPTGMEGQVDGKRELARELLQIIEDSQEVEAGRLKIRSSDESILCVSEV